MANSNGPPIYLPKFPKNAFGLKRGSIIEAKVDITIIDPPFEIEQGDQIPLGYNGEYICFKDLLWDTYELEDQIRNGLWLVTTEYIIFLNRKHLLEFIEEIEQRPAIIQ